MKVKVFSADFSIVMALASVFVTPWGYMHLSAIVLLLPLCFYYAGSKRLYGFDSFIIFCFSVSYAVIVVIHHGLEPGLGTLLKFSLVPILFFILGQIFALNSSNINRFITILIVLLFCFALVVSISMLLDIKVNGFVTIDRNIQVIGEGDDTKNATGVNSMLAVSMAMIGFVFYRSESRFKSLASIILIFLSFVALVFSLRLGSRTGLLIVGVSLFVGYLSNISSYTLFGKLVSSLFLLSLVFLIFNLSSSDEFLFAFQDRLESDEYGASSAGGRLQLWQYFSSRLLDYPFGNIPSVSADFAYAHNIFLDVARVSGLIPMLFLITFFFIYLIKAFLFCISSDDFFLRNFYMGVIVSCCLVFIVEPVIEGCFSLFSLYLFLCGVLRVLYKNRFQGMMVRR